MKPRLPTSKKWTPFPKAYLSQIDQVFKEAFSEPLTDGELIVEGRIYPDEILLRVGFLEEERLTQNNFEVSMNHVPGLQDAVTKIHNCIDAAASMMNEFFQSEGQVDFPRTWKNYDFSGHEIWVQYTTDNTKLEAEADKLLGAHKDELVVEEEESSDALAGAVVIPVEDGDDFEEPLEGDEEDFEPTIKPTLFSGKGKKPKKPNLH